MTYPNVPLTNNTAEQTLRGYVLWRKNSFGTQSMRGNHFIERILSVVETCKRQQRCVLTFLRQVLQAHERGEPPPLPD